MHTLFVDTNVLLLAVGKASPHGAACRQLLVHAAQGRVVLHANMDLVQEFAFHRLRRVGRDQSVEEARRVARLLVLHPSDHATLEAALDLLRDTSLRGRDAFIAASAITQGFAEIVSFDRDFDHVPGLTRREPGDVVSLLDDD